MTDLEYKLIVRFLVARVIGMTVSGMLITGILVFLVRELGDITNDSLTTLMGTTMAFIGGGFIVLANALSRDILEHIERMRTRNDDK